MFLIGIIKGETDRGLTGNEGINRKHQRKLLKQLRKTQNSHRAETHSLWKCRRGQKQGNSKAGDQNKAIVRECWIINAELNEYQSVEDRADWIVLLTD